MCSSRLPGTGREVLASDSQLGGDDVEHDASRVTPDTTTASTTRCQPGNSPGSVAEARVSISQVDSRNECRPTESGSGRTSVLGEICEDAELHGLVLRPRYNERERMLAIGRRLDDASQAVAYELPRPFVALYEIRLRSESSTQHVTEPTKCRHSRMPGRFRERGSDRVPSKRRRECPIMPPARSLRKVLGNHS